MLYTNTSHRLAPWPTIFLAASAFAIQRLQPRLLPQKKILSILHAGFACMPLPGLQMSNVYK